MSDQATSETTVRVTVPCVICGGPVEYDVTRWPNTYYVNDDLVASWTAAYHHRKCNCQWHDLHDTFVERIIQSRMHSRAIDVARAQERQP